MRDYLEEIVVNDKDVIFYDGFLYIISCVEVIKGNGDVEYDHYLDYLCLCPEYDEPLTLTDIAERYPNVNKVIYDDMFRGAVYNYGNHSSEPNAEMWEKVGSLIGYV